MKSSLNYLVFPTSNVKTSTNMAPEFMVAMMVSKFNSIDTSDYDFLIIVTGEPFKRLRVQEFHDLNVSVSVMHLEYFQEELKACTITLLRLIYLPAQFKLREKVSSTKARWPFMASSLHELT